VAATVGIYGIGMKRSMYRMGTSGSVVSQNEAREFEVSFTEEWTKDDEEWNLQVKTNKTKRLVELGTKFTVSALRKEVSAEFNDPEFIKNLSESVSQYYSYIIKCGLKLKINSQPIKPLELELQIDLTSKNQLKPHVFELTGTNVSVFGVIGIRPGKIIGDESSTSSRDLSGITVVCNDRVVLYCNKDWRTGWGESPVPHFHNQFVGITGIVRFTGKADAIPMATDKRQIKFDSDIFAAAKVSMKKGIKRFTEMTNKWKGREKELRETISALNVVNFDQVKTFAQQEKHITLKKDKNLEKFFKGSAWESAAKIPEPPKKAAENIAISFSVEKDDYETVSEYLFPGKEVSPAEVGEKCFNSQLRRAQL
jgi:hypothetical protein